mmetsp:Transcript_4338/g.12155  ORF Transcript_4338/g.12155 Transcript_4338/m.12155 type:complete len:270 (-) Transcript_4338:82-891(-)|eukprot:CAMPEP_0119132184 /NCGR_PEP_ID=MMETSP1310-20130426/11701_1 /TAXON_ID=464262 /ORGANISM="Genus nov. species nov., Strain RCC2339" /LENGTH=269 /DNA_ID=CAMNT_0007122803 /DNA_START=46 /DNA_END=855 /DNA_ORIENTATION=-
MELVEGLVESVREYEADLVHGISLTILLLCVPTFVSCLFIRAPYGRYHAESSGIYGFYVNGRVAWVLQECPCVLIGASFLYFRFEDFKALGLANQILFGFFMCHYIYRALIFPFLMRGVKPTPFLVMMMAFAFCLLNGFIQIHSLAVVKLPEEWIYSPRFVLGTVMFWTGLFTNAQADHILRNLRKPGETGYKIPHGGAFRLVSAANYFGEIVEWTGFAIASSSLAGLSFALFTFSNIGPRGYQHHLSYLERFGDKYPKNRAAVIPFFW